MYILSQSAFDLNLLKVLGKNLNINETWFHYLFSGAAWQGIPKGDPNVPSMQPPPTQLGEVWTADAGRVKRVCEAAHLSEHCHAHEKLSMTIEIKYEQTTVI